MIVLVLGMALTAATAAAQGVNGAFETPPRVWGGQVFDLTLAWRVDWNAFGNFEGDLEWKSEPLVAEPWAAPAFRGTPAPGASTATILRQTKAMALTPGRARLEPARQVMVLRTGTITMGDYERAVTAPVPISSAAATLEVRPLPAAPEGFTGGVGKFTVRSFLDKTDFRVGDSVTWTAEVSGVGNWPSIRSFSPRQVSRDFAVSGAPKLQEDPAAALFERTVREDVVLIPQRAGQYVLSAFEFVAFDPELGRYVTLVAPPITVEVKPGPNGDLIGPEDAAPVNARKGEEPLPPLLKGTARAAAPPGGFVWGAALTAAPLALIVLWLLLALQRAHNRDPDRDARRAHARLLTALEKLSRHPDTPERRRLVRGWQSDAALRWKLGKAAPIPESFGPREDWRRLWSEADLFLYGRERTLPDDWTDRARRVLGEMGAPPPFRPAETFRRSNLLPALGLLMAVLVIAPLHGALAQTAAPAAKSAQANTVKALRDRLQGDPRDWRTRYNLSVTLAAQDKWEEAAGQAAVAWLQNPAAPETRAMWIRAAAKAGYSLEPQASVPRPSGWRAKAMASMSAAAWRWFALGSVWFGAGALAVLLLVRFGQLGRNLNRLALALLAVAILVGGASAGALAGYGALARPDAVIIWRAVPLRPLPVDTPASEEPVQLSAGAAGHLGQTFLGWRQVRFGDGRSGWLRQEDLLWVWGAPR
jgi:hypothetical protein